MSRETPELGQDTGGLATERGSHNLWCRITIEMFGCKICTDPVACFPASDIRADENNFTSHVGAWDQVVCSAIVDLWLA